MDAGCAVSGWLKSVGTSTRRFLEEAAMRRRLRAEFSGLGCDLDRVLADIGLTRDEMETMIKNSPRSRALQQAMLKRLGLEQRVASLTPDVARSIERRCATCSQQAECGDWVAHAQASDGYPRFCPNAETFEAVARLGKAA